MCFSISSGQPPVLQWVDIHSFEKGGASTKKSKLCSLAYKAPHPHSRLLLQALSFFDILSSRLTGLFGVVPNTPWAFLYTSRSFLIITEFMLMS